MLQRQGQLGPDGAPVATRRPPSARPVAPPPTARGRTKPREFLHEVNVELRKVAWPTRAETINYSTVVLIALVVLTSLIFGLDYVFSKASLFLFK
jgi:preprotein translocase SecE subunit